MERGLLADTLGALLLSCFWPGQTFPPLPPLDYVLKLISTCESIFSSEPSLLDLQGTFTIVGDLHGNVADLLRIFGRSGYPPGTKYVFLGDMVDRGQNSVEVVLLLFTLKALFPSHIHLLRGNHECPTICGFYGFMTECEEKFNSKVYNRFIDLFAYLPFAAKINSVVFCTHGGICPELKSLAQIAELQRPMLSNDSLVSTGLVWSDPKSDSEGWQESDRGTGYLFNEIVLENFLRENGLSLLIRSHECCRDGFDHPFGDDGKCITVFSNSDYCGIGNDAAIAQIRETREIEFDVLRPLTLEQLQKRRLQFPEWILNGEFERESPKSCPVQNVAEDEIFKILMESSTDLVSPVDVE